MDQKQIKYIPVTELFPHKDNPRKDIGDIAELSDSIKANGIFQNLTVVPAENGYTVIIGHRRLAAAKQAGLETVPCIVTEMTEKEQLQTMLLENMQRSDLTVYEQAQGFQMMMDLGSSVKEIATKSGFSETTVRNRVKLAELDGTGLKKACEKGATIFDLLKLNEIKDVETRNKVLAEAGTPNFEWKLKQAIRDEKTKEILKKLKEEFYSRGVKEVTQNEIQGTGKCDYVSTFSSYNIDNKINLPEDLENGKYVFSCIGNSIYLYEESEIDPEELEKDAEHDRIIRELQDIKDALFEKGKIHYQLRKDFVKSYKPTKGSADVVMKYAIAGMAVCNSYLYNDASESEMKDLCDIEIINAEILNIPGQITSGFEKKLLATIFLSYDDDGMDFASNEWNSLARTYVAEYVDDERKRFVYNMLMELGYEPSDDELAIMNGTHELFAKAKSIVDEMKEEKE